jgi:hypothetical protein
MGIIVLYTEEFKHRTQLTPLRIISLGFVVFS